MNFMAQRAKMTPNSILGRYLTKQIIINFIMVLLMVLGVVLLFEVIELLRRTSDRDDVGFALVMELAVTKMPRTIEMVFPFVMMIAAMVTFWKLSKSNEFVIIRATGVSIWGVLSPVLLAVFGIGVFWVAVLNPISAKLFELKETLSYRLSTDNPNAMLFSNKGFLFGINCLQKTHSFIMITSLGRGALFEFCWK